MNTRKSNKQNKNKKTSRKQKRNTKGGIVTLRVPNRLTSMPDKFRTNLKYWKAEAIDLSVSTFLTTRFHGSGAFPDFANLTKTPNQFPQHGAFYSSYRIHGSKIRVELVNTSPNSAVQLTVLPTNLDPGSSPSADYNVDSRLQSYARSKMASTQGGPKTTVTNAMSTARIYGNPMVKFDDNFAAIITTNPLNTWFWVICLYSLAAIPSDTPILMNIFIDFDIEFYDRRVIVDTTLYNHLTHGPLTKTEELISEVIKDSPEAFPEDYKLETKRCSCNH